MLQSTTQRLLMLLVAAFIVVIGAQVVGKVSPAQATDSPKNIRALLEDWKKITETEAISVSFQLNTSLKTLLTPDGTNWIEVPAYDQKADFEREWFDIGDDYVCFNERGGQVHVISCIPFSNIAEVVYAPPI
jgi:hypothetical protein